jgi:hypothetical protein
MAVPASVMAVIATVKTRATVIAAVVATVVIVAMVAIAAMVASVAMVVVIVATAAMVAAMATIAVASQKFKRVTRVTRVQVEVKSHHRLRRRVAPLAPAHRPIGPLLSVASCKLTMKLIGLRPVRLVEFTREFEKGRACWFGLFHLCGVRAM